MLAGNHGNNTKSARKVKNVDEAQQVAHDNLQARTNQQLLCHRTLCLCEVVRANEVQDVVDTSHIASQLQCCANCSCAATSDTYGSSKCVIRRMSENCVYLTKACNQSSLLFGGQIRLRVISGSGSNSCGRKCISWCSVQWFFLQST